jgi:hypothetical protein
LVDTRSQYKHLLETSLKPGDATIPTLELLWRAAPEQVKELDRLFGSGVQTRALHGPSPVIAANFNAIQISEEFLQQLWLLAHGAWEDLKEFSKLKATGETNAYNSRRTGEAVAAAKQIARRETVSWPDWVPAFREVRTSIESKAIRELFAMSCAWAIFHEAQHATFFGAADRPTDPVEEERRCDAYALDCLFSDIEQYVELTREPADKVRGKRASGALVGLYAIAKLSAPNSNGDPHPPPGDRIRALVDRLGDEPVASFWTFAFALMYGLCARPESLRPKEGMSMKDAIYLMLEHIDG